MLCKGCGSDKDPALFYSSNKSTCKECVKTRARKNRDDNIERCIAYDKARADDPERAKVRSEYQKTEAGKLAGSRAKSKYKESNPKKRSVHVITGNAIRDGKLTKGSCFNCGTNDNIVAHHCDYDKPLEVMWLCAAHHTEWHQVNGEGLNG